MVVLKTILFSDAVVHVVVGLALVGIVAVAAWPMADTAPMRYVLMMVTTFLLKAASSFLTTPFARTRIQRFLHRHWGANYEAEVGGIFLSKLPGDEHTMLTLGLTIARGIYGDARIEAKLANRILIHAGRSRTIRLDLPQELDELDTDDERPESRKVEFRLWGYDGRASRMEKILDAEVAPLINQLVDKMQAQHEGRNFWLRVDTKDESPHLRFYLRDVPDAKVDRFQMNLRDTFGGDTTHITVREAGINISARTPLGLVGSAKVYLGTPTLFHRHGF